MKIRERIKSGGFWVSLISSVFLILGAFGIEVGGQTAGEIINGICSALVVLGIISNPPTAGKSFVEEATEADVSDAEINASENVASVEENVKEV